MISNNQILIQIEKQLQIARQSTSDSAFREHMAAIRVLCELALDSSIGYEAEKITSIPKVTAPAAGIPIKEEDANGESLFDF